jgi:hypothetical protein
MKKSLIASLVVGAASLLAAGSASAAIDIGDSLDVQYWFPSLGQVYQSAAITFTGNGQTVDTQYGITTLTLYTDHVVFSDHCGAGCFQSNADWNGPALVDTSDATAFVGWHVSSDTMGATGSFDDGGTIAVNWEGLSANGATVMSAVPEPSATMAMLLGLAALGGVAARRARRG